jgi:hypothetical protein
MRKISLAIFFFEDASKQVKAAKILMTKFKIREKLTEERVPPEERKKLFLFAANP